MVNILANNVDSETANKIASIFANSITNEIANNIGGWGVSQTGKS